MNDKFLISNPSEKMLHISINRACPLIKTRKHLQACGGGGYPFQLRSGLQGRNVKQIMFGTAMLASVSPPVDITQVG